MSMCESSSCNSRDYGQMRFRNIFCKCGRKTEVMISENPKSKGRLFFRYKSGACNYFQWWRVEFENAVELDQSESYHFASHREMSKM